MSVRGVIYFVQVDGGGPIKIGFTGNLDARVCTLQAWCPYELKVLLAIKATASAEFYCHETLRAHRRRGEWFDPHPFVFNFIESIRRTGRIAGLPGEAPKHGYDERLRIRVENLIPQIWPDTTAMAKAMGLKNYPVRTVHHTTNTFVRIILGARKAGVNLKMADVAEVVSADSVTRRAPYKLRPFKARKKKAPKYDVLRIAHGVEAKSA